MKKPINEIERLKLIAGLINEVNYNDSVYGVKRNILTEAKKKEVKEVSIDVANPYEYRHGLQFELELMNDYSNEALEKAKTTVLKNLAKDANFYSNLLNQKQSPYEFKSSETDAKGMQAKADGYLKKEAKKDEKANVQDTLGKKEEGSKKPKGVEVMPDKGVTGSEKTIKEGLDEAPDYLSALSSTGVKNTEDEFNALMDKYDWYYEMSDDPRAYDRGLELDKRLKIFGKQIGVDKAVAMFNAKAPSDRKVTSSFFNEDKHTKLKELLKAALKKKVSEDKVADENAKKSAVQTEKAKLIALNKQRTELQADTTKVPSVKDAERKEIDLKIRAASDQLNKLNQGKITVV